MYSLSKQYNLSVEEVKKANSNSDVLSIGSILNLPVVKLIPEFQNIHTVGPKETLYSISVRYATSVNELKSINNLSSNALKIGQKLMLPSKKDPQINQRYHTVQSGETLYSLSKKYKLSVAQIKAANNMQPNEHIKLGQRLAMPELELTKNTSIQKNSGLIKCETSDAFGTRFSECLHNEEPIGSIIKVYVKETKTHIYLKVVGKLPESTEAQLIINQKACDRLNPEEKSFHGEISNIN
jgi:LysM repeat protein